MARKREQGKAVKLTPPPGAELMPWSYSKLSTFEECPLKAKFQYLDKVKVPEKAVFVRGNKVHEALDKYVSGEKGHTKAKLAKTFSDMKVKMTPKPAEAVEALKKLRKTKGVVLATEEKWGFDRDWKPTASWFASGIYCRMVVDVGVIHNGVFEIVDYKTGRMYEHHEDQGELYALGGMCREKDAKKISVKFVYIEHNAVTEKEYPIGLRGQLRDKWAARAEKMAAAVEFPATPNDKCKWCEFKNLCQEKK